MIRLALVTSSPALHARVEAVLHGLPVEVVNVLQLPDADDAPAGLRLVDVDGMSHAEVLALAPWARAARRTVVLTGEQSVRATYAAVLTYGARAAGTPEVVGLVLRGLVVELLEHVGRPVRV